MSRRSMALSLFAGLRGPAYGRRRCGCSRVSSFVGCLLDDFQVGAVLAGERDQIFVFGGLVAANARSPSIMTVLAAGLGLTHGWLNGAGLRWSLSLLAVFAGLAGAIFVLVALVSALVIALRPPWTRIAG